MPQEQRSLILNTVSDAFALHVASDTDSELLSTLILSWKASCKVMPHSLSDESRQLMSKALEAQLTSLAHRDQERVHASADKDEDDLLELQELAAGESEVYYAINFALPELMGQGAPQTAIQPFLPFLQLVNSPSLAPKNFGLRFVADTIASLGDASLPLVQTHLESILHALSDEGAFGRRVAPLQMLILCPQQNLRPAGQPATPSVWRPKKRHLCMQTSHLQLSSRCLRRFRKSTSTTAKNCSPETMQSVPVSRRSPLPV